MRRRCFPSHSGGHGQELRVTLLGGPHTGGTALVHTGSGSRRPTSPLSAGLQVLVREHVELTVQPTGFVPEQFCFALK